LLQKKEKIDTSFIGAQMGGGVPGENVTAGTDKKRKSDGPAKQVGRRKDEEKRELHRKYGRGKRAETRSVLQKKRGGNRRGKKNVGVGGKKNRAYGEKKP